jgi:hypothetical protein
MKLRCPVCHAESALDAVAEDDCARELLALLAGLPAEVARPLLAYLGLFRSPRRALAWARALRIARQALALCADYRQLAAGLEATVEALHAKREQGHAAPLGNQNYLRRVLEGLPPAPDGTALARPAPAITRGPARAPARPLSATEEAVLAIRAVDFGTVAADLPGAELPDGELP